MQITINSLGAGLARTIVPIIYAILVKWGLGAVVTTTVLQDGVTVVLVSLLYAAVRYLEQKVPALGYLIGAKVVTPTAVPAAPATPAPTAADSAK